VLDPATGTGGYLLEVLRVIAATLRQAGEDSLRAMELKRAATRRVFGFEILPAPFVVAHLQIATLLASQGARLEDGERAGVFLTNSLTGWNSDAIQQLGLSGWPALRHEAETASAVKREARILVILGNPPYYGFAGVAEDEEHDLIAPYYVGLKERFGISPRGINDLYVRFLRLAERQIAETTGRGVVSFITNYGWLNGLSHAVMREHMIRAFDRIWIDSLNGDKYSTGKRTPWGTSDQSIFTSEHDARGIQVGTAITTMLCQGHSGGPAQVRWRQFWGKADEKRDALLKSVVEAVPAMPYEVLVPSAASRFVLKPGGSESDYLTWPALDDIFVKQFPGFKTSRDADLVSIDREPLEARMRQYFDPNATDEQVAKAAPVLMTDASRYEAKATRGELLRTSRFHADRLLRVAYRPLDERWLYWESTTKLLDEKRVEFFEQVFSVNLYLAASTKSRRGVNLPIVTDKFSSLHLQDPYSLYFPLYVREPQPAKQAQMFVSEEPQSNLAPALLDALSAAYGSGEVERAALAENVFFHILAVSRSPLYESENGGYLMQDWPRIPLPATRERLEASA
ncbi:MAG: DNA methyltransferase, partial [Ktedonobacterales bacterium]|nr:DNA methyltransferase [Ktedonobacterales bacterium]